MAIQVDSRARRSRRRSHVLMSEINVTPFVDVMLVLLVVFMVTAPLLTVGVQIDLPRADAKPIPGQDEPLTVSVKADGSVFLQETETPLAALGPRLVAITGSNPDARIFVRGDRNLAYGRVMEVMATVTRAGFRKVALVAEAPRPTAADSAKAKDSKTAP